MSGGSRRQVWLEVVVTGSLGQKIFSSGENEDGYLPKNTRRFIKIGVDKADSPVGLRFWRYIKIGQGTQIKSGETRNEVFHLPETIQYPSIVSTRVLYQVFAKSLTEKVKVALPNKNIPEADR